MRKFKVIALSVGGHSNQIFTAGQTVTENQFLPGHADARVKSGHIEEIFDEPVKSATTKEVEATEKPVKDWNEDIRERLDDVEVPANPPQKKKKNNK